MRNARAISLLILLVLPGINSIRDYGYKTLAVYSEITQTQEVIDAAASVVGIEAARGMGSATYIGDGLFVSAFHVVEGSELMPIWAVDHSTDTRYQVDIVVIDDDSDIVILKARVHVLIPPVKVATQDVKVGDIIHGVGFGVSYQDDYPGCQRRLWSGLVTGFGSAIGSSSNNVVKSSNPAIPGDSGGGVFNDAGELLGPVHATDYIHMYSIDNSHLHKVLRKAEDVLEQKEETEGGAASEG